MDLFKKTTLKPTSFLQKVDKPKLTDRSKPVSLFKR